VGGLLLLTVAIIVLVGSLPDRQSKQTAFGLLMPIRASIPAQSNGFALLLQAGKLLSVSNNESILLGYTNWNETAAREILVRNQAAMVILRQAWACPFLQVAAITNWEQDIGYLHDWKLMAQLALTEAHLSFSSGNQRQGFAQAVAVVRFGQRLQQADGTQIHYLVGTAVKMSGLDCIRRFAVGTTISASNLVLISEELTNFEASQEALRQTLKVEFSLSARMFDDMATNPVGYVGYIYSAQRSKQDLVVQTVCTMMALTNCYATGLMLLPGAKAKRPLGGRLLHGNLVGTILNEAREDEPRHLLAGKCRANVAVRATRLALVLRAFQIENQRPASSLPELVPNFLRAVPLDDFDGKPLRYSPRLNEVYSVGVNLVDAGGVEATNSRDGNILFPLYK
jgi:hypothetical protein